MSKKLVAALAAAMCVFCTNLAFAQDAGYTDKKEGADQSVIFKDGDVLSASAMDGNTLPIRVMPSPKRVLLLRPRTQFVTELLKSVEAL
jgi:hypothetical protein